MTSRVVLPLALACTLLFSTGCLRTFSSINVHRDGSADIQDTMLFSPRLLAMMRSMDDLAGDSAKKSTEKTLWNDSLIRADASSFGSDVELVSWHEISIDGMQGYAATYHADDVNTVFVDMDRSSRKMNAGSPGDDNGTDTSESKKQPILFEYSQGTLTIRPPKKEESATTIDTVLTAEQKAQEEAELRQNLDMMSSFLNGIKIGVWVTVDRPIIETNASFVNNGTITIAYLDFDILLAHWQGDLESFKSFDSIQQGDTEAMKAAMDSVPDGGLVMEFQPVVTIKF